MTSDVREGVCFVVATSAPSLPRHDGDPAPVDGDGRARPALDLQEIGGRGRRDPPLLDPGGAAVAHDLALDELRAGTGAEVRVRPDDGEPHRLPGRLIGARLLARRLRFAAASP